MSRRGENSEKFGAEAKRKTMNFLLQYQYNITDKIKLRTRLYGQIIHNIEQFQLAKPDEASGFTGMYLTPQFIDFTYGADVEAHVELSKKNNLFISYSNR